MRSCEQGASDGDLFFFAVSECVCDGFVGCIWCGGHVECIEWPMCSIFVALVVVITATNAATTATTTAAAPAAINKRHFAQTSDAVSAGGPDTGVC